MAITPEAGKLAVEEAADRPYGQSADRLGRHHHLWISKERLEALAQRVGGYWLERDQVQLQQYDQAKLAPAARVKPDCCTIYADGVMVHTDGAWHEARVGTVCSQVQQPGQEPQVHRSSVVRLSDPQEFGRHLWRVARELGYAQAPLCAFIADGSHWLWSLAGERFGRAIQILDFYHLAQHVHQCAEVFFGQATEAARRWALQIKGTLRASMVDEALRRVETLPVLTDEHRQAKHELVTYLTNNCDRMDYVRYEKLGLPIGSGEVEAQCKTLVQARCKQAGMRWSTHGLESLLRVRCAVADGSYHHHFGHWPTPLCLYRHQPLPTAA
jgi:hypothetical protein